MIFLCTKRKSAVSKKQFDALLTFSVFIARHWQKDSCSDFAGAEKMSLGRFLLGYFQSDPQIFVSLLLALNSELLSQWLDMTSISKKNKIKLYVFDKDDLGPTPKLRSAHMLGKYWQNSASTNVLSVNKTPTCLSFHLYETLIKI